MSSYASPSRSRARAPYTRSQSRQMDDNRSVDEHGSIRDDHAGALVRRSMSNTNLPRSGSESSLFGGLKSVLKKPFSWLATPARGSGGSKRDFSPDAEDPPSPSDSRKRIRRASPSPPAPRGDYDPIKQREFEVTGRAVAGSMIQKDFIPPLPSNVSLSGKKRAPSTGPTNFSRPLASSQSMPYLDPPSLSLASPSRRRNGVLSRSRRINLGDASDDEDMNGRLETMSPQRENMPKPRDFGLSSISPFRTLPASPSRFGSLARSNTMRHLGRGHSVASDISMGSSVNRKNGSSIFGHRHESRMSMGSSADIFGRGFSTQLAATAGSSSFLRESSTTYNSTFPAIRNGPMVWDAERGFVLGANEAERILFALENRRNTPLQRARDSAVPFTQGGPFPAELVGASTRQIRKAINVPLATAQTRETLRSKREKELKEDRQRGVSVLISPYGRKRQAEDESRHARAAEKRAREREAERERDRQERARVEREKEDQDMSERGLSVPATDNRSRRTRSISSRGTSHAMDEDDVTITPRRSSRLKRATPSPEPEPSLRSQKSKTKGKGAETPKRRSTRKGSPPPESTRRSARKRPAERGGSPSPPPQVPSVSNVPTITETAPSPQQDKITSGYQPRPAGEMPKARSTLRAQAEKTKRAHEGAATFTVKANVPGSGRFSAKEEDLPDMDDLDEVISVPQTSFTNISFAPFATAPQKNTPASEGLKSLSESTPAPASAANEPGSLFSRLGSKPGEQTSLAVPTGGPVSRLTQHRPRASSPLAGASVTARPESPPSESSAKLAPAEAVTFVATPLTASAPVPTPGSTTPAGKPPANSFFSGLSAQPPASNPAPLFGNVEKPKKAADGLGLGKPSEDATKEKTPTGIPDFFGKSSSVPSTAAPAPTASPFNFGVSAPTPAATPLQPSTASSASAAPIFNFGASTATTSSAGEGLLPTSKADDKPASDGTTKPPAFSFGKPGESAPSTAIPAPTFSLPSSTPAAGPTAQPAPVFKFGATSAVPTAETPKVDENPFSFGAPPTKPTEAQPSKTTFNFSPAGSPAPSAPLAAETPKTVFSFGTPAGNASLAKAEEPSKQVFNFSAPATSSVEPPKPVFTFGTGSKDASQPPAASPSSNPFGAINFGKPAETPAVTSTTQTSTSFKFGSTPAGTASGPTNTISFGDVNGTKKRGNDDSSLEPPRKISSMPGSPGLSTKPFNFGSTTSAPAQNTMGGFGNTTNNAPFSFVNSAPSTPTMQPANPFGAVNNAPAGASAPLFAAKSPAPAAGTPAQSPAPTSSTFNFNFGGGSTAPAAPVNPTGPFQFGAGASSTPAPGFGTTTNSGFNSGSSAPNGGGFGTGGSAALTGGFANGATSTPFGAQNCSAGFGASAPAAASFGSTPGFGSVGNNSFGGGFGQPTPAQATPSPSTPNFSFGSQPQANGQFVFGSAPGGPSSPAGGGFSLGTGTAPPGSPSGRAIKPLRRGTKK